MYFLSNFKIFQSMRRYLHSKPSPLPFPYLSLTFSTFSISLNFLLTFYSPPHPYCTTSSPLFFLPPFLPFRCGLSSHGSLLLIYRSCTNNTMAIPNCTYSGIILRPARLCPGRPGHNDYGTYCRIGGIGNGLK